MPDRVTIRPSFWRLCILGLLSYPLFIAAYPAVMAAWAVFRGRPIGVRMDFDAAVASLCMLLGLWLFFWIGIGVLGGTVTTGKEGLRNVLGSLLRWEELRRVRSRWPSPFLFHVASAGFLGPSVTLPKSWIMGDTKSLYRAIEEYAPQDSPIRRLLPTGEEPDG
ncbi:MAG: hypothetical protein ACYTKD_04955 [Planctomycetota bacterium]